MFAAVRLSLAEKDVVEASLRPAKNYYRDRHGPCVGHAGRLHFQKPSRNRLRNIKSSQVKSNP